MLHAKKSFINELEDNIDKLTCFNKSYNKSLAPAMYELIAQLKSAKVTSAEIEKSLPLCEGMLKNKLKDCSIGIVRDSYQETLKFFEERKRNLLLKQTNT